MPFSANNRLTNVCNFTYFECVLSFVLISRLQDGFVSVTFVVLVSVIVPHCYLLPF
jgi:hypothetical protein